MERCDRNLGFVDTPRRTVFTHAEHRAFEPKIAENLAEKVGHRYDRLRIPPPEPFTVLIAWSSLRQQASSKLEVDR
jgi:hypothetical protein